MLYHLYRSELAAELYEPELLLARRLLAPLCAPELFKGRGASSRRTAFLPPHCGWHLYNVGTTSKPWTPTFTTRRSPEDQLAYIVLLPCSIHSFAPCVCVKTVTRLESRLTTHTSVRLSSLFSLNNEESVVALGVKRYRSSGVQISVRNFFPPLAFLQLLLGVATATTLGAQRRSNRMLVATPIGFQGIEAPRETTLSCRRHTKHHRL